MEDHVMDINTKVRNLLDQYFEIEEKFFFRHLSKAFNEIEEGQNFNMEDVFRASDEISETSLRMYDKARTYIDSIEKLLNCKYNKYAITSIELSDPHWSIEGILPDTIDNTKLKELIDSFDLCDSSRWSNPMLICVPFEVYSWLDKIYGGDIYCCMAIYAIAGPNSGYTSNYHDWIKINKEKYLPKILG